MDRAFFVRFTFWLGPKSNKKADYGCPKAVAGGCPLLFSGILTVLDYANGEAGRCQGDDEKYGENPTGGRAEAL